MTCSVCVINRYLCIFSTAHVANYSNSFYNVIVVVLLHKTLLFTNNVHRYYFLVNCYYISHNSVFVFIMSG